MGNTDRRKFIQHLSLGTSGILASKYLPPISPADKTNKWEFVRNQFPLTKHRIYLNNGTFGPSPYPVIARLNHEFMELSTQGEYGNTNSTINHVAAFINCKKEEVCLTHNTTEGINIAAHGIRLEKGDEVIVTDHEHVGNALPWLNVARLKEVKLRVFTPRMTKAENIQAVENLITPKTKVIAIPHITCTTGLVMPLAEICRIARPLGIITAIDGAHSLGTLNLDMKALDVDLYAMCGHKWLLGPSGTGALYIREALLETMEAIFVGAYSDKSWTLNRQEQSFSEFSPTAHRYFYGTQSKAQFSGMDAAIDFHNNLGKDEVEKRIHDLNTYLFSGLSALGEKLEIFTPKEEESRICMTSFKSREKDFQALGKSISEQGFRIRLVPESNLNAIRISTHIYNNEQEIDRFLNVLESLI